MYVFNFSPLFFSKMDYNERDVHVILHAANDCGDRTSSVVTNSGVSKRQKQRYAKAARELIEAWKKSGTPIIAFYRFLLEDEKDKDLKLIQRYELTCRGFIKGMVLSIIILVI